MIKVREITFDYTQALTFFLEADIFEMQNSVEAIHNQLHSRSGTKNDYKGWVDLPIDYGIKEFQRIKQAAKKIQAHSEILLVIGVGGSYLGSKAAIDMLQHQFHNLLPEDEEKAPKIIFVGHNMSTNYVTSVKEVLEHQDFSINVISKSGTTTEPAIAFRIFKKILLERYGEKEAKNRIFVTTDANEGALYSLVQRKKYEKFIIPDDVGGRYSVLTAVGLLPMAVSGINIEQVMNGAKAAYEDLLEPSLEENSAYQYATVRNLLYDKGKTLELLVNYDPNMGSLAKWWQQLFAESEGKNNQGIYPSFATFPTELHSIGQYIQDGRRDLFETIIKVDQQNSNEFIHYEEEDIDGLNYLANKSLEEINDKVYQAAVLAHTEGGIPNLIVHVPEVSAYTFGYLVYFFQKACAMSSYLFQVNPFDQPGVEAYKKNMYALLGKPGFEEHQMKLKSILKRQYKEIKLEK